eukprot:1160142-Pelagomonas_calceolata.AAC.27
MYLLAAEGWHKKGVCRDGTRSLCVLAWHGERMYMLVCESKSDTEQAAEPLYACFSLCTCVLKHAHACMAPTLVTVPVICPSFTRASQAPCTGAVAHACESSRREQQASMLSRVTRCVSDGNL